MCMKTRIPRDNIHMSWRPIDGFNKAINVFISPREPGKTDTTWWEKIYSNWVEDKRPWAYLVRQVVEITDAMIQDIQDNINRWAIEPIQLSYNKGGFKDGILDCFIYLKHKEKKLVKDKKGKEVEKEFEVSEKTLFIRIIALSIPKRRIKLAKIPNIAGVFMDEFIIDPKSGEKYLKGEFSKLEELYTTYRREYKGKGMMKMYFCGNPYSLFNPLFVGLGVDVAKLRKDVYVETNQEIEYNFPNDDISFTDKVYKLKQNIYLGDDYAIEWGVLHPVLKRYLLAKNPFYQLDEEYSEYALEGCAINDKNIKLATLPKNFYLSFVLKMSGKYIGIFQNNYINDLEDRFFCKFLDEVSAKRSIYCFEFEEMVERSILMDREEREKLQRFKNSMRKRTTSFEDINVYYYMEEVYKNL